VVLAGASMALFSTFSLSRFWSQVSEARATIFGAFATQLELLWKLPPQENDRDNPLRIGLAGHIPPQLHRPFERRFGVRLFDVYGLTEAEPIALPRIGMETPVGSCGLPTPDFEVAILDEDDCLLPAGEIGEIAVRPTVPDCMMRGYEGDEAATVQAWRNLWFHTGDLGYRDAHGFLYFVERRQHAIRRRGENISSWELEHILMGHPEVAECAAARRCFAARRGGRQGGARPSARDLSGSGPGSPLVSFPDGAVYGPSVYRDPAGVALHRDGEGSKGAPENSGRERLGCRAGTMKITIGGKA
jgi:crotonobetaine/carnitine-CoA ligase